MAAPLGNKFWLARTTKGPPKKFADPKRLWDACVEYFEWAHSNPLQEDRVMTVSNGGNLGSSIEHEMVHHMRPFTIMGLCNFLDIVESTWRGWRNVAQMDGGDKDLLSVITRAEQIIKQQKFDGAAANLLNPVIIARDLGLADKKEVSGPDGEPLKMITSDTSLKDAAEAYAATLNNKG